MTLDTLDATISNHRDQAASVVSAFEDTVRATTADTNLTEQGVKAKLSNAYDDATDAVRRHREGEKQAIADEFRRATNAAFGLDGTSGADLIAYRDAVDRADRINSKSEALGLLQDALTIGDRTMAQALMRKAFANGWESLYDEYQRHEPTRAQGIADLAALTRRFPDGRTGMLDLGAYYVAKPAVLGR